jgi:hypothetical protein
MAHMAVRNRVKKQDVGMNLRSHSLDKLNHYDRRIYEGFLHVGTDCGILCLPAVVSSVNRR